MNLVVLVGKVKSNPEIKNLAKDDLKLVQFLIEVKPNYVAKGQVKDATLIQVNVWNNLASELENRDMLDNLVAIRGKLSGHSFKKDDGTFIYRAEVNADNIAFLSE